MTEFQSIDFQTYNAVQDAITVLENADKTPYTVSKMGEGLGAAYAARLRELAETDVDDENMELSHAKIVAVCDEIYDMVRLLKWIWVMQRDNERVRDNQVLEAVTVLENIEQVAFE